MTDKIEELIKEIAVKHGVAVGKDDPVLILQTINARLIEENTQAQQIILNSFKEEMEALSSRWSYDAKEKAERILNVSLNASKEAMAKMFEEGVKTITSSFKEEINELLQDAKKNFCHSARVALFDLVASIVTILAVSIAIIDLCFQLNH